MTLPTPNLVLPESAGFNLTTSSPRQYKIRPGLVGGDRVSSNEERGTMVKEEQAEDMLTTPVLTTPKTGDLWSQLRVGANDGRSPSILGNRFGPAHDPHAFSPENLTVTSPTPIEMPRDPPNDLPMDSEIGLRSPCDGLLAQRRRERFRDKKQMSSLDSNSMSDTPTSENNSPRDLTMGSSKRLGNSKSESEKSLVDGLSASCDNSGYKATNSPTITTSPTLKSLSKVTSSNTDSIQTESFSNSTSSTTLSTSNHNNNITGNKPPNIEVQDHGGKGSPLTNSRSPIPPHFQKRDFKLPSTKPENLRILNGSLNGKDGSETSSLEYPSHYTPSPLAVPSPNWTAVERYFGREYVLRTPRLLDGAVFDFLSPPYSSCTGISSSSAKSRFPRSPGNEAERYLGWDQHLSPRLSPRFPIPEKPEDLSNGRGGSNGERKPGDPPPYEEAATDLSTKRQQKQNQAVNNIRMSSSPTTGDSDSNGGGPASNLSSASPATPPSPVTHPTQRISVPQQQTTGTSNRQPSTSPINGIQHLLSKTNFQQEPPNLISRTDANQQRELHHSNPLKHDFTSNTKQPQLQEHAPMQIHQGRVKIESPHLNVHSDIHRPVSVPHTSDTNIPIKSEVEDYEYNNSEQNHQTQHVMQQRHAHQSTVGLPPNTSSGFGNPYYITQGFTQLYNRQQEQSIYSNHMDSQRPSPPTSAPPPKISPPPPLITGGNHHLPPHTRVSLDYNRSSPLNGVLNPNLNIRHSVSPYSSSHATHRSTTWNSNPSPGQHIPQQQQSISQCQPNTDISNIHARSLQHHWTTPSSLRHDDEASISPPSHHFGSERGISNTAGISVKPTTALLNRNQGMFSGGIQNGSLSIEKKRGRKPGGPIAHDAVNDPDRNCEIVNGERGGPPGTKKPRTKASNKKCSSKAEVDQNGAETGGPKRSYSCPHCQRSYDWNYNLNRHLKYECGKENAFQCAKCGRRFPHKQNCVYHLKRKHKIICETIDQYVAAGLVVFHGNSNSAGQGSAKNPEDGMITVNNSGILPSSVSQPHTQIQPISTSMTPTRVA